MDHLQSHRFGSCSSNLQLQKFNLHTDATLNDFDPYPLKGEFQAFCRWGQARRFQAFAPRASVLNQKSGIRSVQTSQATLNIEEATTYYTRMSGGLQSQPLQAIHHTIALEVAKKHR